MSSGSEKRQCGLFAALEGHKEAGGNGDRRLESLNPRDGHFLGSVSGLACLQYLSLAAWISGMVPNTEFGFNTLFSLLFFQNVILSARMH